MEFEQQHKIRTSCGIIYMTQCNIFVVASYSIIRNAAERYMHTGTYLLGGWLRVGDGLLGSSSLRERRKETDDLFCTSN